MHYSLPFVLEGAEGDTGMIVAGEVHALPAGPLAGTLALAGDAMAGTPEPPQLLDVQVQQVACLRVLVAVVRARRLELGQPVQSSAAHQARDRAQSNRKNQGDLAIGLALATQFHDSFDHWQCRRACRTRWARGA